MAINVEVKKVGNSLGIILPAELVREKKIKVKDKINIEIVKECDYRDVFGSLKRKMSGQEFKDLAREGWD